MDEPAKQSASMKPNHERSVVCEECKLNPSKYKCPGCSVRSCSLACIKAHKQRSGCSGKRPQTQFVPISQFNDDLILSDYNMLEDVKRVAESAQRKRLKLCGHYYFRPPPHLKSLGNAAASRRTRILFLPRGMSKRETNRSSYNNRKKLISWTIEWRFYQTDVVLTDHGVNENLNLCSVIQNHLVPSPWNHPLKQFCDEPLESLKLFIRKYPKGPKSPFVELDPKAPIRQQLANVVILEYPVIHVLLPSHSYNFAVIKNIVPPRTETKPSELDNQPSPKGVAFREEEIEEDDSTSDPKVLDLMNHRPIKPGPMLHTPSKKVGTKRERDDIFDATLPEKVAHVVEDDNALVRDIDFDGNIHSANEAVGPRMFEDADFDFEQGLIDAYSDLIAEANPDDFLDWEGVFPPELAEELHVGGGEDQEDDVSNLLAVVDEELEEGEIPGF